MTKADPNSRLADERLAEYFEPKASLGNPKRARLRWSPLCMWYAKEVIGAGHLMWEPVDFVGDGAMRDFLQEKLLEAGWRVELWKSANEKVSMILSNTRKEIVLLEPRESIWQQAALKAFNLTEESNG